MTILPLFYKFEHILFIYLFIYLFFCLIAVLKDCQYFLKRSGDSRHPCLILDFGKKAFSFEYYIGYGLS